MTRFAERTSHQIFLEPEGLTTHEIYPNGISTSLPFDVQLALVRTIEGLRAGAHPAAGLRHRIRLFRSARAQGDARDQRHSRAVLRRADQRHDRLRGGRRAGPARGDQRRRASRATRTAGIRGATRPTSGVLVDDLVTRGVTEPYRMFTSRAEYRLQLREDNADLRLTETGRTLGLVDDRRWDAFCRKRDAVARELERLKSTWVNPNSVSRAERRDVSSGQPLERDSFARGAPAPAGGDVREPDDLAGGGRSPSAIRASPNRSRSPPSTRATSSARTSRSRGMPRRRALRLPGDIDYRIGSRAVERGPAETESASTGNAWACGAHFRGDARRGRAAAGASQARLQAAPTDSRQRSA